MELRAREAAADGKPWRPAWRWVSYNRISPALKRAVIVSEDAAFWGHDGLDLDELRVSIEDSVRRGVAAARRIDDHAAAREEPVSVAVATARTESSWS